MPKVELIHGDCLEKKKKMKKKKKTKKKKKNKLILGDCLEKMQDIPDGSVDALISDIPYGISISGWDVLHNNKNSALLGSSPAQGKSGLFKVRGKPLNGWSEEDGNIQKEYYEWCSSWLKQAYRVLKPASPLLIMTGRQRQHRFTVAAENAGMVFKDYIVWDKISAPFRAQNIGKVLNKRGIEYTGSDRLGNLAPLHEPVVYMFKPYKKGTTLTDNFIQGGVGCFDSKVMTSNILRFNSKVKEKVHETQKPLGLMEILVSLVTKEGHLILDPFMGSGTTGVACKNLNRNFIGIEQDENYFEIAKNRIEKVEK